MKFVKTIIASTLIFVTSLTVYADMRPVTQSFEQDGVNTTTPMMGNQQGGMPMLGNQQGGMPMMGNQQGSMPMMGNRQGGMPMMGNRHKMMQSMMSMKQQHMQKMENHLANIEALLRELVVIQKNKSK